MLIITKVDWSNQLNKLELMMKNIIENGFKFNIKKSLFGQNKIEYMGLWVTRIGIRPINRKIEVIVNMIPPKIKNRCVHS